MIPTEFIGTLPGWITALCSAGGLGLVVKFYLGHRAMNIKADEVRLEGRKIDNAEEANLRAHWKDEVESLRRALHEQAETYKTQLTSIQESFKASLDAAEERHDKCVADRQALEGRVGELEEKIRMTNDEFHGVIRLIAANSADKVLNLPANNALSADVAKAAERVRQITSEGVDDAD